MANKVMSGPLNDHRISNGHQIKINFYCDIEYYNLGMFF